MKGGKGRKGVKGGCCGGQDLSAQPLDVLLHLADLFAELQ